MNKEVMMLHELQTPPVSSNLGKQVNKNLKKSLSFTSQISKNISIYFTYLNYIKKAISSPFWFASLYIDFTLDPICNMTLFIAG